MSNSMPIPKPWTWQKRMEIEVDSNGLTKAFEIFDGYKRIRYSFEYNAEGILVRLEKAERVE